MAQIRLSSTSRGIADHFYCFTCDHYVWDCDHLIDERLTAEGILARPDSPLESLRYDGKSRTLEVEFRVTAPHTYNDELPLPPLPKVIHYFGVPRYIFTRLQGCPTGRKQEQFWVDKN